MKKIPICRDAKYIDDKAYYTSYHQSAHCSASTTVICEPLKTAQCPLGEGTGTAYVIGLPASGEESSSCFNEISGEIASLPPTGGENA